MKKQSRKDKIWEKFCNLPRLHQFDITTDICLAYDDFREMLRSPKDFYGSLKELEADINERSKLAKKQSKMNQAELREFYDLCQVYRHTSVGEIVAVSDAYNALVDFVNKRIKEK